MSLLLCSVEFGLRCCLQQTPQIALENLKVLFALTRMRATWSNLAPLCIERAVLVVLKMLHCDFSSPLKTKELWIKRERVPRVPAARITFRSEITITQHFWHFGPNARLIPKPPVGCRIPFCAGKWKKIRWAALLLSVCKEAVWKGRMQILVTFEWTPKSSAPFLPFKIWFLAVCSHAAS